MDAGHLRSEVLLDRCSIALEPIARLIQTAQVLAIDDSGMEGG